MRRVYDLNVPHGATGTFPSPRLVRVENYITHNGDFDFFTVNGVTYDLEVIQAFLIKVLGPMPASVDSCAVAGLVDVLRSRGCFALSARYVICLGLKTSKLELYETFPIYAHFASIGNIFEDVLTEMLKSTSLDIIEESENVRQSFAQRVESKLQVRHENLIQPLSEWITDDSEGGSSLLHFCRATIDAFFDNDLLLTTKRFLENAKGSFGLCVTSSLDADRQICLASRGQTMSVAFYPSKGEYHGCST